MRAKGQTPHSPHQLAYWTTLYPNPALSTWKVVGWSMSKLKQKEEARAGEEGEETHFGEGSPSCSISLAPSPLPHCPLQAQCPSISWSPGPPGSALLLSFRWSRDSCSPTGLLASFSSSFPQSNAQALKILLSHPSPWAPMRKNPGKLGAKWMQWTEYKIDSFCLLEKRLDCPGNWPLFQNLLNFPKMGSVSSRSPQTPDPKPAITPALPLPGPPSPPPPSS